MGIKGTSSRHALSPGELLAFPSYSPGGLLPFPSELGIDPKDHEIRSLRRELTSSRTENRSLKATIANMQQSHDGELAKMQQCHDEEQDELERMRVEPWRA